VPISRGGGVLLKPLGQSAANGIKFFRRRQNCWNWSKIVPGGQVTNAVNQHWRKQKCS